MPTTRVLLCRHGETDWNREGRYQGFRDISLNENGTRQASQLAEFLKEVPIDAAFSSHLSRANRTAATVMEARGLDDDVVTKDEGFAEISHGTWEGRLSSEAQEEDPELLKAWREAPQDVLWPEGDSVKSVQDRAVAAFKRAVLANPDKSILIGAHDAVNKSLLLWITNSPLSKFWSFKQDSTCLNIIDVTHGQDGELYPCLILVNSVAHTGKIFSDVVHRAL